MEEEEDQGGEEKGLATIASSFSRHPGMLHRHNIIIETRELKIISLSFFGVGVGVGEGRCCFMN